jgi:hypothetical protein
MKRIAGTVSYRAKGRRTIYLRGDFRVSESCVERVYVRGGGEVRGYQDIPRVPFIDGEVTSSASQTNR